MRIDNDKVYEILEEFISWLKKNGDLPGSKETWDLNHEPFKSFANYLNLNFYSLDSLTENEAFRIYNDYRMYRKRLTPIAEVEAFAKRKYLREYEKKNFKKITSKKSILWLASTIVSLKRNNLFVAVENDIGRPREYDFNVLFVGMEEIWPNAYALRKSDDSWIVITDHLLYRYAERTKLKARSREDIIKYFLATELSYLLDINHFAMSDDRVNFVLSTGLCLGHKIKDLVFLKTFVNSALLGKSQVFMQLMLDFRRFMREQENNDNILAMNCTRR